MTPEQMAQTLEHIAGRRDDRWPIFYAEEKAALAAGAAALRRGTCDWREDDESWNGACGVKWVLTDGTPAENGMLFCPRCGRHLIPEQTTTPVSAGLPCNTGGEWWKAGDD